MQNKNLLVLSLLVAAMIFAYFGVKSMNSQTDKQVSQEIPQEEVQKEPVQYPADRMTNDEDINIGVNPLAELSYKTKDFIYDLRKKYVSDSIFSTSYYKPSAEVFGGIESGKPWIENTACIETRGGASYIGGVAEESRFINNPTMLVAIEFPFNYPEDEDDNASWCGNDVSTMIPKKITFNGAKKEISVTYERLPFKTVGNHAFYTFNGLNARDLGYKYAYIDKNLSTYEVDFTSSDNISNRVVEFQNYIHVGGSCGHSQGCNNGSPRQSYLEFKENSSEYIDNESEIYIKLWKEMPLSPSAKPDIVEKIIFEQS